MKSYQNYLKSILIFSLFSYVVPAQAQVLNRPDFFRRGYEQMQQEINQLQRAPNPENPSQLLTIKGESFQWQKFVFQKAGFSLWMPQAIQSQEALTLDTSLGKIPFELLATHPNNWRFVAAYSDPLEANFFKDIDGFFLAIQQGIIAQTQFKLTEDKSITFQSYIGREWTMENAQEIIKFRVYLINQRVYVLAVRQPKVDGDSSAQIVTGFFDSFGLLP